LSSFFSWADANVRPQNKLKEMANIDFFMWAKRFHEVRAKSRAEFPHESTFVLSSRGMFPLADGVILA
jgi:hypothetical protein